LDAEDRAEMRVPSASIGRALQNDSTRIEGPSLFRTHRLGIPRTTDPLGKSGFDRHCLSRGAAAATP